MGKKRGGVYCWFCDCEVKRAQTFPHYCDDLCFACHKWEKDKDRTWVSYIVAEIRKRLKDEEDSETEVG